MKHNKSTPGNHGIIGKLDLFNSLFYRNLEQNITRDKPIFGTKQIYSDDVIAKVEYEINSHGYRGKDFTGSEELMILGCSQTYGRGIPQEFTWGHVFANKINKKYVNLAQEGDSAQAQVYKAFNYFKEFGNPKIIVASLPSTRIEMPCIPKKFGKAPFALQDNIEERDRIQQIFLYDELEKYSKSPHNPQEILPVQFTIFYSFMFVQILEQYCESNNIMLIWNIWDDFLFYDYLKTNVPEILNNYLNIKFSRFMFNDQNGIEFMDDGQLQNNQYVIPECHQELKDHPLFYRAADYNPGISNGHYGIHLNQHIAEDFYHEYVNRISGINDNS